MAIVALAAGLVVPLLQAAPARAAYTPIYAVEYANYWANSHDPSFPTFADDCTNFISQALWYGGEPMVGGVTSGNGPSVWYIGEAALIWVWSHSWTVANDSAVFWLSYSGKAQYVWTGFGDNLFTPTPPGVGQGDLLYYVWDYQTDDSLNHMSMITVVDGYDQNQGAMYQEYGDLTNDHSSAPQTIYQAFWSHWGYNSTWPYEAVDAVHITG